MASTKAVVPSIAVLFFGFSRNFGGSFVLCAGRGSFTILLFSENRLEKEELTIRKFYQLGKKKLVEAIST